MILICLSENPAFKSILFWSAFLPERSETTIVIVNFRPQRQYKICVTVAPCLSLSPPDLEEDCPGVLGAQLLEERGYPLTRSTPTTINQSINQSINQISQFISRIISKLIGRSIIQSFRWLISLSISRSFRRLISWSISRSFRRSISQSIS